MIGTRMVRAATAAFASLILCAGLVAAATPASAAGTIKGVSKPKVTGTKKVGKKLTGKPDKSVKPSGTKRSYQWLRSGQAIAGATGIKYTLAGADRGKKVAFRTCYEKPGYAKKCVTSKSYKVGYGTFTSVAKPTISGTRQVGQELTAKPDAATTPKAESYTYQWYRSGATISGATKASYTLVAADKGKAMSVKVGHKAPGYTTKYVTSAKTGAIAGAPTTPTPPPEPDPTAPPTITSISRTSGTLSGGEAMTITGTNLTRAKVTFKSSSTSPSPTIAATVTSTSPTTVKLTVPAGLGGQADLTVTTVKGSATAKYTYVLTARQLTAYELDLVKEINARRTAPGGQVCGSYPWGQTSPVTADPMLNDLAQSHVNDLGHRWETDYGKELKHTTAGTAHIDVRYWAAGYGMSAEDFIQQNVANVSAASSAKALVDAWMGSPVHCATIMDPDMVSVGIGTWRGSLAGWTSQRMLAATDFLGYW